MLPREFDCSGRTCWRRLRDWQTAGVWTKLHRVLLERLSGTGQLNVMGSLIGLSERRRAEQTP
ncbi:transposase [Paracoccus sediminis]|uniref:Transposase n=1 Tax=Paracoccus sediminis TaxID=1214787 RepID=A0ABY1YEQ5_9RHOB|nr:transposase [Paracoccus sediminis]